MANFASVVIQDLTFTCKTYNVGLTITYTNTGTAGSEVVTVTNTSGIFNISVAIESSVSTAAQIKTAIEADATANGLVTVTASGTPSTAQDSCVSAALAGGAAVAYASKTIGDITYTAKTAGTGGNSVRVKYTSGATAGAEVVSVSTNDITVQIADGESTIAQIQAAVAADGSADALVGTASSGSSTSKVQYVAMAAAFTALTGGVAAAASSVVVQDLTIAAEVTGTAANGKTVTYTTGATAGAEVVTVTSGNVNVQIENGVSTATQVKAALDASAAFNGVAASGTVTIVDYTKAHLTAASGSIIINAYAPLHLTKASGTITYGSPDVLTAATKAVTVVDYTKASSVKASGTVTVVDYTKLAEATATPSGVITYGTPSNDSTVIVTGPAGGPYTFTKVASDPEANQFTSIAQLTFLLNQISGIDATDDSTDITLTVETAGTAPNAWTVTGTSSYSALSITFSGGQNHATCTINGTVLTEGTDWTAATDNDTTATSLETAIEAVTDIDSSATGAAITVECATAGAAGNAYTLATSDAINLTISGAVLANGRDATTVTIAGHALVANVDWTAETDNDTTADNLAAAINALTEVNAANPAAAEITVTAATAGAAGNSITLVTSYAAAVSVGGAVLSGGLDASTITVGGSLFTCVAATPGATEFSSISELTALVAAVTGVDATDNGTVIAVVAATAGTAGNSIAMAKTGAGLTLSGALLTGGIDAATVTIAGHVLTESTDWTASTDTATTAESLKDAIHALTEVNCTRSSSTCNIVAATAGTAGNAITAAVSDAVNMTLSGAVLSGGIDALEITVGSTTLVESTDWNSTTNNDTAAEALKDAIHALSGVSATRSGAVVTIVADAVDSSGNSIALTTSDETAATVSGTTLTGGTNVYSCTISGTGSNAQYTVNALATSGAVGADQRTPAYFLNQATTALTSDFVRFSIGFYATQLRIQNNETSGANTVIFSFDGTNVAGTLAFGEDAWLEFENATGPNAIYLKYGTGAPDYKVEANV